eukprot:3439486-Rhodomonas_salina.2
MVCPHACPTKYAVLTQRTELSGTGNPITSPPPEVVEKGAGAVPATCLRASATCLRVHYVMSATCLRVRYVMPATCLRARYVMSATCLRANYAASGVLTRDTTCAQP